MKTKLRLLLAETLVALLILVGTLNASEVPKQANEESNLQLEEWMMDETTWSTTSANTAAYAEEMEELLVLENWMTDSQVWNSNFRLETEASMELENWMTDETVWDQHDEVAEAQMTVEGWMINSEFWQ